MKKELRHDRHTVSLLTDHMVFSPKYRGKVLVGDVAMVAGVPSKAHIRQLVKIQPEERLATTSELNPTPSLVTD